MLNDSCCDNENYCLITVLFNNSKQNVFKYNSSNTLNIFLSEVIEYFNIDNKVKLNFSYLDINTFIFEDLELLESDFINLLKKNCNRLMMKVDIDNKYLTKRYEVLQNKINKYGNATIMLCIDHERNEKVIIKKQKECDFFLTEYEFLLNTNNPLIIKAYDYFELQDLNDNTLYSYYTMPYFENGDLFKFIKTNFKDKCIPLKLIFEIIYQISYGLFYMHSKRRITTKEIVVHRDIDLKNIFVKHFNPETKDIEIIIGDFGHATILKTSISNTNIKDFSIFNTVLKDSIELMNSLVGKTLYWSPEQYKREEYDFTIDIWGLGVIFYHLLTKDFNLNIGLNFIENKIDETLQNMKNNIKEHTEINDDNNELINILLNLMISYNRNERCTSIDVINYLKKELNYSSKYCNRIMKRLLTEDEIEANKIMDELYEDIETNDLILKLLQEDYKSNDTTNSSSSLTTQSSSSFNKDETEQQIIQWKSPSSFNKDEVEKQIIQWKNKLKTFICPISQQLMIDPVIISETGQTYDRSTIERWLQRQNTCPSTGIKLKSKTLTPNYIAKSAVNETVEKFVKKVTKNVKLWSIDINLTEICFELINESLDLIKNNNNYNNYQKEMHDLKFNILLNELNEDKLFNNYMKAVNELQDSEFKLSKLIELENKLINDKNLQKYYYELLNFLIELKNNDLIIEIYTKYCKLNKLNLDNNLIDKLFNNLETDEVKLDFLITLFNESDYDRNNLLQKLLNSKIKTNKHKFIPFFKNLFKEIALNKVDLEELKEFIKDYISDLSYEIYIIGCELKIEFFAININPNNKT
ncbi:hypothetical protein ABK040_016151 [Willaertia magna]